MRYEPSEFPEEFDDLPKNPCERELVDGRPASDQVSSGTLMDEISPDFDGKDDLGDCLAQPPPDDSNEPQINDPGMTVSGSPEIEAPEDFIIGTADSDPAATSAAVNEAPRKLSPPDNRPGFGESVGAALPKAVERIEQKRSSSSWDQGIALKELGREYTRQGARLEWAAEDLTDLPNAIDQLRLAQRLIHDLGASLVAVRPPFSDYADTRYKIAAATLHSLDLSRLVTVQHPPSDGRDGRDKSTIASLVEEMTTGRLLDPTQAFGMLAMLESEVSALLEQQPDTAQRDNWIAATKAILASIGRFITAVGTAFLITGGSLMAADQRPNTIEEIQAAAAMLIGASCALLRRDFPALWRQPDITRHLTAADSQLRYSVANLRQELDKQEFQNSPTAADAITSYVFDVQYAAYAAASVVAAIGNWPQVEGYLEVISCILDVCEWAHSAETPSSIQLTGHIQSQQAALAAFQPPAQAQLRPDATLRLVGRLHEKVTKSGEFWPPINI